MDYKDGKNEHLNIFDEGFRLTKVACSLRVLLNAASRETRVPQKNLKEKASIFLRPLLTDINS